MFSFQQETLLRSTEHVYFKIITLLGRITMELSIITFW